MAKIASMRPTFAAIVRERVSSRGRGPAAQRTRSDPRPRA